MDVICISNSTKVKRLHHSKLYIATQTVYINDEKHEISALGKTKKEAIIELPSRLVTKLREVQNG